MAETADRKKVNLYVGIKPRGPRRGTGVYAWLLEMIREDGTADPRTLAKTGSIDNVCDKALAVAAATEGLRCIKKDCDVTVLMDPEYLGEAVSGSLSNWVDKWEKNGWKTSSGSDVKDAEIWKEFLAVLTNKNAAFAKKGAVNPYRNWMRTELSHALRNKNADFTGAGISKPVQKQG